MRNGLFDIYAQNIDLSGNIGWIANGIPICTAFHNQYYPQICSDGSDGAIITWFDYRSLPYSDIFVQFSKYALETLSDEGKRNNVIPYGIYPLFFSIIAILSLIIIYQKRIYTNSKKK